jgi:hypothetical protein
MGSWPASRHSRPALDHAGGAPQRYGGQPEPPTAQRRPHNPRGRQARAPGQTLAQMTRQRAYLGGGVLLTVCRYGRDAGSARAAWGGQGWPCRRPGRRGAEAPRGRERARPAPGGARAPQSSRAWSRGAPHRRGRAEEPGDPRGGPGGLSGRRRGRWDGSSGHAKRGGLVLRLPYGHAPDGARGGRALAPCCLRHGSPPGEADGAPRGRGHTRGVGARHGAVGLGQGGSRAPGSGQPAGDSRGGVSLVSHARPHRDLCRRPEKPRRPEASVAYLSPPASLSVRNSSVFRL